MTQFYRQAERRWIAERSLITIKVFKAKIVQEETRQVQKKEGSAGFNRADVEE